MILDGIAPESDELSVYPITWVGMGGDTLEVWEIPFEPIPIPANLRAAQMDRAVETLTEGPDPLIRSRIRARAELEAAWDLPHYYPPVSGVTLSEDDRIWVRRESAGDSLVWYDLIFPDGEVRAHLQLPSALGIQTSIGSTVWATERDSLGVHYLSRFQIWEEPPDTAPRGGP